MTDKGLDALMHFEGYRQKMYRDPVGNPTIGVGHLLTPRELETGVLEATEFRWTNGLSEAEVRELLRRDVDRFEDGVNNLVKTRLYTHEFDALVSWAFNVGLGAVAKSDLLRLVNAQRYEQVPLELAKWNRAGGRILPGLVNRREAEFQIWSLGHYPV